MAGKSSIGGRAVNPKRVLVTGGEHTGPLAAVRALRAAGYEPCVAVSTRAAYAARSRASQRVAVLPDSRTRPEAFVRRLREESDACRAQTVLPGTDRDLLVLARRRSLLGPLAEATPPLSTVLIATSKHRVNRLAAHAGLTVPRTLEVTRGALPDAAELGMPAVAKPPRSELQSPDGGLMRGHVERINTPTELLRTARNAASERLLVQPVIEGRLGAVCGVAWDGAVVFAVHQVSRRIWPPDAGVSAYAETVAPDRELELRVAQLIRLIGWRGIFQAQFIHAKDGSYFIDLNPRIYGSLALAVAAGANLPAIWVAHLKGEEPVVPDSYRSGVRYRCEELDGRALLHALRTRGPLTALAGLLPHRHTTHAVATLDDPLPLLTSLGKLRRRILDPPAGADTAVDRTSGRRAVSA